MKSQICQRELFTRISSAILLAAVSICLVHSATQAQDDLFGPSSGGDLPGLPDIPKAKEANPPAETSGTPDFGLPPTGTGDFNLPPLDPTPGTSPKTEPGTTPGTDTTTTTPDSDPGDFTIPGTDAPDLTAVVPSANADSVDPETSFLPVQKDGRWVGALERDRPMEWPEEAREMEQLYQKGLQELAEEKYKESIETFNQLLAMNSRLPVVQFERGVAFMQLKEYAAATQDFSKVLVAWRNYPNAYLVYLASGRASMELQRYSDALDDFNTALSKKPGNAELLFNRASALIKLAPTMTIGGSRNLEIAIESLDKVLKVEPNFAKAYFERGRAQAQLGEWEKALEDVNKATTLDPENIEFVEELGLAFATRGDRQAIMDPDETEMIVDWYRKSIDYLTQAIKLREEKEAREEAEGTKEIHSLTDVETDLYLIRANTQINLARFVPKDQRPPLYQAAVDDCKASLEEDEERPSVYLTMGIATRLQGDFHSAMELFSEALNKAPNLDAAKLRRGIVWFYLDEYELALGDFKDLSYLVDDPRPTLWAGICEVKLDDYGAAVHSFTKTIRAYPDHVMAYANRGLAYIQLGRYQRAVDDFNQIIRRDFTDATAYYRRGVAQQLLGDDKQAARSFRMALYWDPGLTSAKEALQKIQPATPVGS